MAREVQGLLVQIEASTAQLRREMANADRAVAGSTKKIDKELSLVDRAMDRLGLRSDQLRVGMSRAFVGIATGAAAAGASIAALTKQGMAAVDAQAKLARSLDTSFDSITALQMAAGDSGLDGLEGSLTRLNRRLGAAEAQSGAAAKAVKALNLDLKALSAMDVDERVATIADAIRDSGHSMQRAARHAQDLGFEQKEAAQFFMQGGDAIRAYRGEVDALGLSLSDIDAQKVVEAGNAMGVFGDLTRGVTQRLAVELSPVLQQIAVDIEDLSRETRGFSDEVTTATGKAVSAAAFVADSVDGVGRVFSTTGKSIALIVLGLQRYVYSFADSIHNGPINALNDMLDVANRIPHVNIEPRGLTETGQKIQAQLQMIEGAISEAKKDIEEGLLEPLAGEKLLAYYREAVTASEEAAKAFVSSGKRVSGTLGDIVGAGDTAADAIKAHTAAIDALIAKYDPATKAQAEYEKAVAVADKALANNGITTKQYQQILKGLATDLNKPIWDKHNKAVAEAEALYKQLDDQVSAIRDRLDPLQAATRKLAQEKELLARAVDEGAISLQEYELRLRQLDEEYAKNQRATTQWTEWTESALERVDSAFADAWRNIGDGFSSFRDSLTNAFKQMLAELAHMAITRPIIMQIGAAMGIGGGAGMAGIGGGGGGGMDIISLARNGYQIYQGATGQGLIGSVVSGFQTGGLSGAWGGATGWAGGATAGLNAAAGQMYGVATQGGAGLTTYAPLSYQMGGASAGVAAAAPWAAGFGGAYMGYQQAGVKGAAAGAVGGWGGSKAGAALGSMAGPIGTAVGAVVGGILGSIGGAGLFGSGERFKRTVGSATGYYGDDGYVSTGVDGSFYGGSRKFGDEFDASLDSINERFVTAMGGLFEAFDVDSSISTTLQTRLRRTSGRLAASFFTEIDGQLTSFGRQYSKDGKLGEAMEQFADDIMGEYLAKTIVGSSLPEYFRQQFEPLAADSKVTAEQVAETLTGIFTRFDGVNSVLELTRLAAFELTDAGMRASDAIIALSGGLDALQASTSVYYDQFFSAAEKQADTIAAVEKAFAAADITLADSRESYRAMVEDIDVTTEAGQQMFAAMMALSGQAAQYFDILDARAAQSVAMLAAGLDASLGALQRSIAAQQKRAQDAHAARIGSLNDMAATASSSISALTSISNSLDAAVKRLRGTSDDATRSLRAQAVMTLNSALVSARSGQSLAGFDGLQDALDVASQMDTALYSSLVDFEREQGRTANLIAELEKVNGKQLSAEERLLEAVRSQISAAERQFESEMSGLAMQLAYAQSQVDALSGIDNSIMGVAAAVAAMNASVVAALKGLPRGSAQANTPANNLSIVDTAYRAVLGREVDASGREYWSDRLQSGSLEYSDFAETLARAALQNPTDSGNSKANALQYLQGLGIPGFASGGVFGGGLRLVGEQGPELEVTGPSRIYSASQTAAMMQGGNSAETVAELRQLRNEIHDGLRSIAKHTMKTARNSEYLERWDYDGLPQEREAI